jgi:hypothetical protein
VIKMGLTLTKASTYHLGQHRYDALKQFALSAVGAGGSRRFVSVSVSDDDGDNDDDNDAPQVGIRIASASPAAGRTSPSQQAFQTVRRSSTGLDFVFDSLQRDALRSAPSRLRAIAQSNEPTESVFFAVGLKGRGARGQR